MSGFNHKNFQRVVVSMWLDGKIHRVMHCLPIGDPLSPEPIHCASCGMNGFVVAWSCPACGLPHLLVETAKDPRCFKCDAPLHQDARPLPNAQAMPAIRGLWQRLRAMLRRQN